MRKRIILWFCLGGIILGIIGAAIFFPTVIAATSHCTQAQLNQGACTVSSPGLGAGAFIGVIFWVVACLLGLVA
jgi:hypothetical protein